MQDFRIRRARGRYPDHLLHTLDLRGCGYSADYIEGDLLVPPTFVSVLLMLVIFSHVRIAVLRYIIYGQLDVRWPVWCEYLVVFIGLVLGVDGGRRGDLLFASLGFVMMYGHVRKLLHPSSSYYT